MGKKLSLEQETKNILSSVDKLKPFSAIAMKVLQVIEDPEYDPKELSNIIQYDQIIALTCLRLCNSSFFGLKQKVNSVHQAVIFIGEKALVKIILATITGVAHNQLRNQGNGLWVHSLSCAIMSQILLEKIKEKKRLCETFSPTDDYVLYTCALIHDIGRLVLDQFLIRDYDKVEILQARGITNRLEIEKELYGLNHSRLGAWIAEKWGFSRELIDPIRVHHRVFSSEDDKKPNLIDLLILSNTIINAFQVYDNNLSVSIKPSIMKKFDLTEEDLVTMRYSLFKELSNADSLLNLEDHMK